MNTNEFEPFDQSQRGLSDNLGLANGLPDIDQLTQLANQLFAALPCDGSRLGLAASAVPGGLHASSAALDKLGLSTTSLQGLGLPGELELRQLFAQRQPLYASVPDKLDPSAVPGQPQTNGNGLTAPLAGLDSKVLAGIFLQNRGLPNEADLQQLLVTRPPSGSHQPIGLGGSSTSSLASALDLTPLAIEPTTEIGTESIANFPQPFVGDVQKQLATHNIVIDSFPKAAPNQSRPSDLPGASSIAGLSASMANFDASLIAGLAPEVYGLPGESELQLLFGGGSIPEKHSSATGAPKSNFYFLDELNTSGFNAQALNAAAAHPAFDVHAYRRDFPILKETVNGYPLAWFDNAATTQKPQAVIDRISYFYEHENSNIHRAAHEMAARATDAYEQARDTVARFLNAPSAEDIIFVRGTTEGINLIAQSWGRQNIRADDEIVITWLEHHANIVPWQQLCEITGAKLCVVPVDDSGQVLLGDYQKLLNSRTKIVSFTHVSNALGTVTPAAEIIAMAHRVGARVLLDAAQSVSHLRVDVQTLDCDWCVFSGHKIFGPTGIGAVYGKSELLQSMPPWQGGGNMIEDVTFEKTLYQPAPARFEAGTGNIADAVGLGAALEYLTKIGLENVARYEHELLVYGMEALQRIPGLRLIGTAREKTSVLSFVLSGHSNQDIGVALNHVGIAVRTGHHCAQPILRRFDLESSVRPSLAFYNTYEEVDRLVDAVRRIQSGKDIFS
ncbi:MAG: cysteine desulfurase [Methylococcaceae bacterium]|nr:cysteine desulfurase [Methylococcaceae bacterium]